MSILKKPNKTQKNALRWVFLGGFFWVLLGGFFIANPACTTRYGFSLSYSVPAPQVRVLASAIQYLH
jgi:hypothetical protein